jgi:chloride channel, nucleotide-sensitive, 1A
LHPDATVTEEDDDLDDAFISTGENGIPIFTGSEDEELSEAGRVRSDFFNDNRYMPY